PKQSSPGRACHLFSFLLRFPLDRRDFCERAGPQFLRANASRDTGAAFAFRTGKAAQQQADTLSDSYDRHLDDWMATVLSVIDKLRDRKARPDVERIFVMANRQRQQNPGGAELTRDAVASILQRLVEQRQVMRVEYKGSVSYRNASSWHRRKELASDRNSPDTTQRVLAAAKSLPDGATFTVQILHARMLLLQQVRCR
uniref:Cullin_Nedd8 domain-containing protein n=1 Tax=Macrostomum lignano TaxID=282301 RepID=A0A1I8I6R8_9PLAT